jgi:outer membrane lipoprotein SlyB
LQDARPGDAPVRFSCGGKTYSEGTMFKAVTCRMPCSGSSLPARIAVCLFLLPALSLSGCASKYGEQTTQVNYYPDCYAPINELRSSEYTTVKSAGAGAAVGAVLGALVGYAATGKASGALAGAAVGGVAGGGAGAAYGSYKSKEEERAALDEYNARLDGNVRELTRAAAAAKTARQCYARQFTSAASEFKAGHISKAQFNDRYLEITQVLQEAANILGDAGRNGSQFADEYNRALNSGQQDATEGNPARAGRKASGQTREAAVTRGKSAAMRSSVAAVQEEERALLRELAEKRAQAKDIMS